MNSRPLSHGAERPLTPESSMRVSRPANRAVSVLCGSIVLVACSGGLNAQAPAPSATVPAGTPAPSPNVEGVLRALPDFSPLVEKYGPAVVNVAGAGEHPRRLTRRLTLGRLTRS